MGCSLLVRLSEFSQAANDRTNLTQRDLLEKIGPGTTLLHGYSNAPSSSIHLKKYFFKQYHKPSTTRNPFEEYFKRILGEMLKLEIYKVVAKDSRKHLG